MARASVKVRSPPPPTRRARGPSTANLVHRWHRPAQRCGRRAQRATARHAAAYTEGVRRARTPDGRDLRGSAPRRPPHPSGRNPLPAPKVLRRLMNVEHGTTGSDLPDDATCLDARAVRRVTRPVRPQPQGDRLTRPRRVHPAPSHHRPKTRSCYRSSVLRAGSASSRLACGCSGTGSESDDSSAGPRSTAALTPTSCPPLLASSRAIPPSPPPDP